MRQEPGPYGELIDPIVHHISEEKSLYKIATGLEEVVAILAYGRSGSLFFQSLLDGHPDLIVTAGLCLNHYYSFFNTNSHLPRQQLVSQFVEDFAVIFDAHNGCSWGGPEYAKEWGLNCMGANRDEFLVLNKQVFSLVVAFQHNNPCRSL